MATVSTFTYSLHGIAFLIRTMRLSVPEYQRSYAWSEEQVREYWQDLRAALNNNESEYFLGTTVLSSDSKSGTLSIIDGQQRIATTVIFLAAVREIYASKGEADHALSIRNDFLSVFDRATSAHVPKLQMNLEDDPYFSARVIGADAAAVASIASHERMRFAHEFFSAVVLEDAESFGANWAGRLNGWIDFLGTKVQVIALTVPNEADAFTIFETLNDRGADLTIADLLKNFLFGQSGPRLEAVKHHWIAARAQFDSDDSALLVTFLRHFWSSKYGAVRERELYRSIRSRVSSSQLAVDLSKDLESSAVLYAAILSSGHAYWSQPGFTSTDRDNVDVLNRIRLEQYRPLLLALLQHFERTELKRCLRSMVSWSVRGLIVGGIGGGATESAYCAAAVDVRSGAISTVEQLLAKLNGVVPGDTLFEQEFAITQMTTGRISRYLLNALERQAAGQSEPELVPNQNEDEVNLEHVLPKQASPTEWPGFPADDLLSWVHRIGNHALLRKTENATLGNKPFDEKRPVLASSTLSLTAQIGSVTTWGAAEVEARQKELARLAVETWPRIPPA